MKENDELFSKICTLKLHVRTFIDRSQEAKSSEIACVVLEEDIDERTHMLLVIRNGFGFLFV